MVNPTSPIARVIDAHTDVLAALAGCDAAIEIRAGALKAAHASGTTWSELGQMLGVSPQRAYAASKVAGR